MPLIVACFTSVFFPFFFASAQAEPGLTVTVYNNFGYNNSPPLPTVTGRPVVGTTTLTQINQNFDSAPLFNLSEDFIVKYEGHITLPVTGSFRFLPAADDGTKLYIDNVLIDNNWVDKGGWGNPSQYVSFSAGVSKPITYWYYENGGGANTTLYWDIGSGWQVVPASAFTKTVVAPTTTTTSTTTTTIAPYFNSVQNLTAVADNDGNVVLSWNAPTPSNTAPYMYNILFHDLVDGVEAGGWGVWTYAVNTSYSLGPWMWPGTTGYGPVRFKIQAGTAPCVGEGAGSCMYGPQATVDAVVIDPTPPTTTTTTTTTIPQTTSTTILLSSSTVEQTTTVPETTVQQTTTTSTTTSTTTIPNTTTTLIITPSLTTTTLSSTTTTTTTLPIPTTIPTTTTIPEITETITTEEAVDLATNKDVLQEITQEQATQVFQSIDTSDITEEEKTQIIEAVQDAPAEVREAFEEEINIYADGFDDYVPTGSAIPVKERRTLLAIASIATAAAAAPVRGPEPRSGGSGGGLNSPKPSDSNSAFKKEEEGEEEDEEAPEIEGPNGDDESYTTNSIYKYTEDGMKKFSIWNFIKKFSKETAALAFTISSTIIVFATLSGDTRKITLIATSVAFLVHYISVMLSNDE